MYFKELRGSDSLLCCGTLNIEHGVGKKCTEWADSSIPLKSKALLISRDEFLLFFSDLSF